MPTPLRAAVTALLAAALFCAVAARATCVCPPPQRVQVTRATPITIGVSVANIFDVDIARGTFGAAAEVWAAWPNCTYIGAAPYAPGAAWRFANAAFASLLRVDAVFDETAVCDSAARAALPGFVAAAGALPPNTVYQRWLVSGVFSNQDKDAIQRFPVDRTSFMIELRDMAANASTLALTLDPASGVDPLVTVSGFALGSAAMTDVAQATNGQSFALVRVGAFASRFVFYFAIDMMLPLLFMKAVVTMLASRFRPDGKGIFGRMVVVFASFVVVSLLYLRYLVNVPAIGVSTTGDFLYLFFYVMLLSIATESAVMHRRWLRLTASSSGDLNVNAPLLGDGVGFNAAAFVKRDTRALIGISVSITIVNILIAVMAFM